MARQKIPAAWMTFPTSFAQYQARMAKYYSMNPYSLAGGILMVVWGLLLTPVAPYVTFGMPQRMLSVLRGLVWVAGALSAAVGLWINSALLPRGWPWTAFMGRVEAVGFLLAIVLVVALCIAYPDTCWMANPVRAYRR